MKKNSKRTKKYLGGTVAAGVLVASALTGTAQAASPTQLSWFSDVSWWTMGQWNNNPNTVEGTITKKTGLQFSFNVPAQDADTKLNLMMVSGELPDIISLQDYPTIQQLVKAGKVWSITDLMKKYDPSFLKKFPKDLEVLQNQQFGGFYGIPSYATSSDLAKQYPRAAAQMENVANQQIVFNQSIMKQAGITLNQVKTEKGLLAALKKVANMHLTYKGAPVIPLQIDAGAGSTGTPAWISQSLDSLSQMFGAMPVDKNGNYRDLSQAPETKQAIDFLYQAAQIGALDQGELAEDETASDQSVSSGRVFCFLGNMAGPHFDTMYNQDHSQVYVSPGNISSSQGYKPTYGYGDSPGWTFTLVSKSAPDPAAIAKWIDFMWSDQGQILTNWGFKGTDYTLDKQGYVVPTPSILKTLANNKNYWAQTGLTAFWFFTNQAYYDQVSAPSTTMPNSMISKLQQARATTQPVFKYDDTAVPLEGITSTGTNLYQEQQNIDIYWPSQVAKMIFAPNLATENQIYQQTESQLKSMGQDAINQALNVQFHNQEKQLGTTLKGINP